jgi:hypothetical protein
LAVCFVCGGGACGAMARFLQIAALLEIFGVDSRLSRRNHNLAGFYKSLSLYIVLLEVGKNRDKQMKYTVLLWLVLFIIN